MPTKPSGQKEASEIFPLSATASAGLSMRMLCAISNAACCEIPFGLLQLLRFRLLRAEGGGGALLLLRVPLGKEGRLGDIKVESSVVFEDVLEIGQNLKPHSTWP
jgi:hypothetical protein